MSLPYETATTGARAMEDVQKILQRFGCSKFGHMMDYERGDLIVQFETKGIPVSIRASINGYAVAWLREHPYSHRMRSNKQQHEQEARRVAGVAVYSILRDWIKGQITAVETGILSIEGAFLGQIMLPTGKTILETAKEQKLLPAPADEKVVEMKR